ncbi:site-specific DNA-methyltransferase [Helicobacter sp. 11S02629-2]|uniref:DNA-methyltransferase n=1 Tax=Helicobacter sp. 11S02629-2 TaxID=1476195 RepID=UPI000BA61002|nr:site-specific DNA-methyltransferase [Helicobacter sp. 11S02629-2]PAF44899.1 restriction endonuclease [Helicobacter sp. 11S02629-2]
MVQISQNLFNEENLSVEKIKKIASLNPSIELLQNLFYKQNDLDIKRELISAIGRNSDNQKIYEFLNKEAFNNHYMDLVYQMFRTTLYKSKFDNRFVYLREKMRTFYDNEFMEKMYEYYTYRQNRIVKKTLTREITNHSLLVGDNTETLLKINNEQIQLIFTSPPYYNARLYSDYKNYKGYLSAMKKTLLQCHRILEDGRFIGINVSPVITKRAGREFESIRYPIHFDFHNILIDAGFYFVDEIIWIKPEFSVPNRVAGYFQTKMPLSYKPNCISESVMIYRKNAPFLLDKNIKKYDKTLKNDNEIDSTNCWYISPKADKYHPAVFPEELCEKILKYYSFKDDVVCDPFAGSGTFGRVARRMGRVALLCEQNKIYADKLKLEGFNEI